MKNYHQLKFLAITLSFIWCLTNTTLYAQLVQEDFMKEASRASKLRSTDLEASYRLADSLLKVAQNEEWLSGIIRVQGLVAQYHRKKGQYEKAKSLYFEVNSLIEDNYEDLPTEYFNETYQQHFGAYYNIAVIHYREGNYDSTFFYLNVADSVNELTREVVRKVSYQRNQLTIKNMRGAVYAAQGKLKDAARMMEETVVIDLELKDLDKVVTTYVNLGQIYKNLGEVSKSIKVLNHALNITDSLNLQQARVYTLSVLGQQFYVMKYHRESLNYSKKAFQLSDSLGLKSEMASAASATADCYKELGLLDSAQWYYQVSLDLHRELNSKDWIAYVLERMAVLSVLREGCEKAKSYLIEGLALAEENNFLFEKILLNMTLAECFLEEGDLAQSNRVVSDLLSMILEIDDILYKRDVYEIAHKSAIATGNSKQAYNYLLKFRQFNDSIYSEEKALELATANYEYELEKETSRLAAEQERQKLIFQERQNRDRLINLSLSGATTLIAIIAVLAIRAYRSKQRTNKILGEKNNKLKELRESEKLFSEEALAAKDRELATLAMASHEKTSLLNKLQETVGTIESQIDNQLKTNLKEIKKSIEVSTSLDKSWDSFLHRSEDVHPRFFNTLKKANPHLTMEDLKLSAYLKIGMSNKEIANVSHLTPGTIKTKIHRLKKKLKLGPDDSIRDMMIET